MSSWMEQAGRRSFQLWEFHASHNALLIRSPKGTDGSKTNLDLVCYDVGYFELPRSFKGLAFADPTHAELTRVADATGPGGPARITRVLVSGGRRFLLSATQFLEDENDKDLMTSFTSTRARGRSR